MAVDRACLGGIAGCRSGANGSRFAGIAAARRRLEFAHGRDRATLIRRVRFWLRCTMRVAFPCRTRRGGAGSIISCGRRCQTDPGTWRRVSIPGTGKSLLTLESGYPYAHDQISRRRRQVWRDLRYRGAGSGRRAAALSWTEDLPNVEPWVETVLFGSVTDLKRLLDGGFDPNSATRAGGTIALMMAAPDAEKMKLLLDRGADVNARAKSKYSALMVAAVYRGGTPAIKLLLARGGDVSGTPSPLVLAAGIGNAEALKPLHDAGASLGRALLAAVRTGQTGRRARFSISALRWTKRTRRTRQRLIGL